MSFRMVLVSPKGVKGMRTQVLEAREAALKAAGEFWARELLGIHFTQEGARKYRYVARTERHMRRKRREGHGEDPNVYTGRLKQQLMGTPPTITVNRRGLTLVWKGLPRYAFVVDSMEFVKGETRWDDEAVAKTRAWMLKEAERAKDPVKTAALVEKRIAGIFAWRKAHPKNEKGQFKRVRRPDKVKELTTIDRADADRVGAVFKETFLAKLNEKK